MGRSRFLIQRLSLCQYRNVFTHVALARCDELQRAVLVLLVVPPDGRTGIAINYTLRQWEKLTRYTERGDLHISNCLAENAIRPFVVGRKGWLFADTPKGAHASACMSTLVETAKANGVEPYVYLHKVIDSIATVRTAEEAKALLPWHVS